MIYIYTCIRLWWLCKRQYEVGEFAWGLKQYDPGPGAPRAWMVGCCWSLPMIPTEFSCRKLPSSVQGISVRIVKKDVDPNSWWLYLNISEHFLAFFFARNIHLFWYVLIAWIHSCFQFLELFYRLGWVYQPLWLVWSQGLKPGRRPCSWERQEAPCKLSGKLDGTGSGERRDFFWQKLKFLDVFI